MDETACPGCGGYWGDRRPPRSHEPEPAGPLTTAVGIAAGTVFVGSLVVVAVPMMVAVAATETVRRLWRSGTDGE